MYKPPPDNAFNNLPAGNVYGLGTDAGRWWSEPAEMLIPIWDGTPIGANPVCLIIRCECVDSVGSGKHSDYCPKYA